MRRNQKPYSNKYEAYALPKANPAFAIYKFLKGKKCRKLQKYLAISGLQPLAAGDLEGCTDGVAKVTGSPGVRGVLGCYLVLRVWGLFRALWRHCHTHHPSLQCQGVCDQPSNIVSSFTTLNPQTQKVHVSVAEIPAKDALWVLCDRFFLLQPRKAICIHLISEALVIGDISFMAKPDKYCSSPVVGICFFNG